MLCNLVFRLRFFRKCLSNPLCMQPPALHIFLAPHPTCTLRSCVRTWRSSRCPCGGRVFYNAGECAQYRDRDRISRARKEGKRGRRDNRDNRNNRSHCGNHDAWQHHRTRTCRYENHAASNPRTYGGRYNHSTHCTTHDGSQHHRAYCRDDNLRSVTIAKRRAPLLSDCQDNCKRSLSSPL